MKLCRRTKACCAYLDEHARLLYEMVLVLKSTCVVVKICTKSILNGAVNESLCDLILRKKQYKN